MFWVVREGATNALPPHFRSHHFPLPFSSVSPSIRFPLTVYLQLGNFLLWAESCTSGLLPHACCQPQNALPPQFSSHHFSSSLFVCTCCPLQQPAGNFLIIHNIHSFHLFGSHLFPKLPTLRLRTELSQGGQCSLFHQAAAGGHPLRA